MTDADARLRDAWDQLAEQQRQFADDRHRADAEWSHLFQLLQARTADAEAAEVRARAERQELEALRTEIGGLETRAAHARQAIAERNRPAMVLADVPLAPVDGRSAEQMLHDARAEQAAVGHQAATVTRGRQELARYAERLADERLLVAEQLRTLAGAGHRWRQDQAHTLDELEALVRSCRHREEAVAARETAVAAGEAANRRREADLWRFHTRLEAWQQAIMEREAASAGEWEAIDRELAERRLSVVDRERAWDELCAKWDERSAGLRDRLIAEVAQWVDDRKACETVVRECDAERTKFAADAGKLAAGWLAVTEAKAALDPKAARAAKAMEKRWLGTFAAKAAELDAKQKALATQTAAVERRYADLRKILVDATARQESADLAERGMDKRHLPAVDDRPLVLTPAAGATPSARRLAEARQAAEDQGDWLRRADDLVELVRLDAA